MSKSYRDFVTEAKTKSGDEITFKYLPDVEGDENRGWQVDQIDAYVNGHHAGYIKASYIPMARFKKYYHNVLNYMSLIGGSHPLPLDEKDKDYHGYDEKNLDIVIKRLKTQLHDYSETSLPTRKDKIDYIDSIVNKSKNQSGNLERDKIEFTKFKNRTVDKPIVDFIRVFGNDDYHSWGTNNPKTSEPMEFRRLGIGTSLYIEMAKYLHTKKLKLYASTLQSKEAEQAWQNLTRLGFVKTERSRRYIDYSKIKDL